jgi:hypothetical protein
MRRPEQAIHKAVVHYLRVALPHGWLVHHSPNGGKRSQVEAAIFKALGTVPGWPDITVMGESPVTGWPGCWFMEVKAPGGRLTDVQRACHDRLRDLGFAVAVVHDIDEARRARMRGSCRFVKRGQYELRSSLRSSFIS